MQPNSNVMVSIEGLSKSYAGRKVLHPIDLHITTGEVLALLGPNGAGKTTLIRLLATLTTPDSGSAHIAGHDLKRRPRAVRRSIGVAGQFATIDETLTGRENLAMTARLARLPRKVRRSAVQCEIERFNLARVIDDRAKTYSGGTRRRLDIAMSLIGQPRVVLLDEPSVGLDPRSRRELWQRIHSLAFDGITVVLTTQYLDEADHLADRIVLLDRGHIVASGTPDELKSGAGKSQLTVRYTDGTTETISTNATLTDIRARLDRLDHDTRTVQAIEIAPPSLDDVFLGLTGQPATAQEPNR